MIRLRGPQYVFLIGVIVLVALLSSSQFSSKTREKSQEALIKYLEQKKAHNYKNYDALQDALLDKDIENIEKYLEDVDIAELLNLIPAENIKYEKNLDFNFKFLTGKKVDASLLGNLANVKLNFKSLAPSHTYARIRQVKVDVFDPSEESILESKEEDTETKLSEAAGVGEHSPKALVAAHNACLVLYIRNVRQIAKVISTLKSTENNFNHKYHYPWIIVHPVQLIISEKSRDSMIKSSSGVVTFVKVSKPPTDEELFFGSQESENALAYSREKYQRSKELRFGYLRKMQQLRVGADDYVQKLWDDKMRTDSKLFDANSISVSRILSSDIYRLDELLKYDYFLKMEPGTVFDCRLNYDIFTRFANNKNANIGIVFMDKMQDVRIFERLKDVIQKVTKTFDVGLSKYFSDSENKYNGIVLNTQDFFIGKTALFNSNSYLSFIQYIDEMKIKNNEVWSENEIMSAFFALVYNENDYESSRGTKTNRQDILVLDDIGISNIGMVEPDVTKITYDDNFKRRKYLLTTQSCPISNSYHNEMLIKNINNCHCDVDTRFFYEDLHSSLLEETKGNTVDYSKANSKDIIFEEFQELLFSQTESRLLENGSSEMLPLFYEYFESYPTRQSKNLFNIRRAKIIAMNSALEEQRLRDLKLTKAREEKARQLKEKKKKEEEERRRKIEEKIKKAKEEEFKKQEEERKKEKEISKMKANQTANAYTQFNSTASEIQRNNSGTIKRFKQTMTF